MSSAGKSRESLHQGPVIPLYNAHEGSTFNLYDDIIALCYYLYDGAYSEGRYAGKTIILA
jgi:hypothetical protein